MSEQAYQTLYAMLLGESPYERVGAPEPGVLFELVPVLPDDVLAEAVWGVAGMEVIWPADRLRLLAALLERAAGAGQTDLLAQAIVQIPDVISALPEPLLPQALHAIRDFKWWDGPAQATALALLSARAPRPLVRDLLAAIRAPIEYDDRQRAPALAAALSRLAAANARSGEPLPDEALWALQDAVRAMQEGTDRGTVWVGLLDLLDAPAKRPVVQEAWAAFQTDDRRSVERVAALAALSRHVRGQRQGRMLDRAVDEARELADDGDRARAFVALARQADEPLAGELLRELACQVQTLDLWPEDLVTLAPYLSEAQLEHALERLSYEPVMLEGALSELAPYLPERLLAEALQGQDEEEARLAALKALASHLPASLFAQALSVARALSEPYLRQTALAVLRSHMPGSLPDSDRRLLEDASLPVSGPRMRELWALLPEDRQVMLARGVIHATCDRYGGAEEAMRPSTPSEPSMPSRPSTPDPGPPFRPAPPQPPELPELDDTWRTFEGSTGEVGEPKGVDDGSEPTPVLPEERLVNTGFSTPLHAGQPVDPDVPLAQGQAYYFWFQVGRRVARAMDVEPVLLPTELLPTSARLAVALYAFEDELQIAPGADVGEIQVQPDRSVRVVRPVEPSGAPSTVWRGDALLEEQCLFFPIVTPDRAGLCRLRCNVYYEGVLIQSHLVRAWVLDPGTRTMVDAPALTTHCDYTLSNTLRPELLTRLEPHRLSLLINDNGDGTHGFRFFAQDQADAGDLRRVKYDSTFDGPQLQDLIDQARGAMRAVSWGDEEPWNWRKMYRYGSPIREGRLDQERIEQVQGDLIMLAKRGYAFYDATIVELASGAATSAREIHRQILELERLMLKPGGLIQVASKESARHVVPLAMVYDYGLDPIAPDDTFSVCPEFLQALRERKPLGETVCFQDGCPSRDDLDVVCPSGFWGFRHGIGMPASIGGELSDAVLEIVFEDAPQVTMAVSTDERLKNRVQHETNLHALRDGAVWHHAETREKTLDLMGTEPAHIVYFYCHGGVTETQLPYIEVGPPNQQGRITSGLMRAKRLFWDRPRPLVFINGCHTTALEPEVAYDLVESFVEKVGAAGVIGTEITIYDSLAVPFGEACLKRFMNGVPIGEAVRQARLELLQQANPLGLVYDAFAVASLKMVPAS